MPFEDLSIVCNILNLSMKIQASPPGLLIKKFYRILNLAVGGNWGGHRVDNDAFPAGRGDDYLKVYKMIWKN